MERVRLTAPGDKRQRGERARLYIRWMPHLGAEAVALYELLRVLPDVGQEAVEVEELAELLRSTPESVESSFEALLEAGFVTEREGWLEVADHPPVARTGAGKRTARQAPNTAREPLREPESGRGQPTASRPDGERAGAERASAERVSEEQPARKVEVVRAAPEGVSPDDYFKFMGTLPAPHIVEFLNGYCERDGMSPDVVREALRIASERDARRVGYVRSILERWVERGVKTVEDVERFERDRKLRLVEQSGAVKGGAMKLAEGVRGGEDRRSAARRREDYKWFFGE